MTEIKTALMDFNPWWKGEFKLEFKDRELYKKIQKFIPLRQIIAFTGLRRVGKTTIMHKIIEDAISKKFDPRNIIYFSFDEFREIELRKLLAAYEELQEKDLKDGKYLFLLDEIQKVSNWGEQLKVIYDIFKNIKIIISGSESLFIKRKTKETLAGRIYEFKLDTLSFKEFLQFKEFNFKPLGLYQRELLKLFDEFTLSQGLPELVDIKDKEIIKKYVRENLIEKVIYRDFANLFKIKDISIVESLLNIFLEEPGQLIELSELASDLKISRQTLSTYLSYLEKSFLIKKLYNYSKNRRKIERKLKKYYPSLVSAELLFKEDELSKSKIFECQLVNNLNAEFFWRDPYKNEVDIILADKYPMPIEIKYGKIDFRGLLAFMNKFNINKGYTISYNKEEKKKINKKEIIIIPAYKFLLRGL